jgi:peptidyl-prolyl cis-trans isomerase B (cyclophilin B)
MKSPIWLICLAAGAIIATGCTPAAEAGAESSGETKTETSTETSSNGVESKMTIDENGVRNIDITPKGADDAASDEKPIDPEKAAKAGEAGAAGAAAAAAGPKPKDGEEVAVFETEKGRIIVRFRADKAPKHVANFKDLVGRKFYDGTRFHRCIPGFMIQGGDPNSKDMAKAQMWGTGGFVQNGTERQVDLEPSDLLHKRGVLSAARSQDPNSASSQFFLMHQDSASLDGQYSAFGEIVSGIEVVDKIVTTGDAGNNGAVEPKSAIVLKTVRLAKWPVK